MNLIKRVVGALRRIPGMIKMSEKQKQKEQARGTLNPLEQGVIDISPSLTEGDPIYVGLYVEEKIYEQRRKKELELKLGLEKYGTIFLNEDYGHGIVLELKNIGKLRELARDYEDGKLEGIVHMDPPSPMDAVMCMEYDRAA